MIRYIQGATAPHTRVPVGRDRGSRELDRACGSAPRVLRVLRREPALHMRWQIDRASGRACVHWERAAVTRVQDPGVEMTGGEPAGPECSALRCVA